MDQQLTTEIMQALLLIKNLMHKENKLRIALIVVNAVFNSKMLRKLKSTRKLTLMEG